VSKPTATELAGAGLPDEVMLTGASAAPPPVRTLRAGLVGVLFTGGDLRQVRLGEIELARRVYVAVRDLDWNTLPGRIEDLDVTDLGADAAGRADRVRIRQLDQHTFERAIMDPKGFLRGSEERAVKGGTATVTLNPYGAARLDIHHE
jgi:hypothetical protein